MFSRTEKIIILMTILFLILSEQAVNSWLALNIYLPRTYLLLIILSVMIIAICLKSGNQKFCIEKTMFFMLYTRIPFYILNSMVAGVTSSFFAYYLLVLVAPIIYTYIYKCVDEYEKVLCIILKFTITIIDLQIMSVFLPLALGGHGLYQIKTLLTIPVGNSNSVAALILMQTVLAYLFLEKKFYTVISVLALLCTMSKGAFLALGITGVIILVGELIKRKNWRVLFAILIGACVIYAVANKVLNEYLFEYLKVIKTLFNGNIETINNGRNEIFKDAWVQFLQHPIIGNGLRSLYVSGGMAHNFILQGLFNGGILGCVLMYSPILYIVFRMNKWNDKYKRGMLYLLLVITLHGFVENVFLTITAELFIWTYIFLIYLGGEKDYAKSWNCNSEL